MRTPGQKRHVFGSCSGRSQHRRVSGLKSIKTQFIGSTAATNFKMIPRRKEESMSMPRL